MTFSYREYDELEESFGITFGIGIDCEAQYGLFCLYNAHGGQEGAERMEASVACSVFRRERLRQRLIGNGRSASAVKVAGQRPGARRSRLRPF